MWEGRVVTKERLKHKGIGNFILTNCLQWLNKVNHGKEETNEVF